MSDLGNKDKGEFTIVDPDNNDYEMAVNSDGTTSNRIKSGDGTGYEADVNASKELLVHDQDVEDAVNAIPIGGNLNPKFYTSKVPIIIGDTDTTLATLTFDGVVQSVNVNFNRTTVEFALEVDSTEVFRAELADLNDSAVYDLGIPNQASGATPGFVGVSNSGKHIQMSLDTKTATNVVLKARRTTAISTSMVGIIVFYREYP